MLSFLLSWNFIRSAWLGWRSSFTCAGLIHWFKREVPYELICTYITIQKLFLKVIYDEGNHSNCHYRNFSDWNHGIFGLGNTADCPRGPGNEKINERKLLWRASLRLKKFWNENKRKFYRENASIPSLNCHLELFGIHDCGHPCPIHRIGILMPEPFTVAIIALNLWVAYQMLSWWVPWYTPAWF